ncbi:unnamed protein product [Caenorhabditis sp. 36 PRJEB53466]|nr:unnamed protein product [Caenorhabditis sp. 36 PRJEB53466]
MKLKKRPMKLSAKRPVDKAGKVQKQKQKAANLASAEKVMAQFESGAVDTNKKKNSQKNGVAKTNGATLDKTPKPEGTKGSKWYSYQIDHVHDEKTEKMSAAEIQKLLEEGREFLAQDAALLQTKEKQENGSEASWLYSVISKGTAADKRTAMQLQMHKSPVHSLEYVEKLIASCKKQGTRDVVDIIPILEDVFINHCLPENRKLIPFSNVLSKN